MLCSTGDKWKIPHCQWPCLILTNRISIFLRTFLLIYRFQVISFCLSWCSFEVDCFLVDAFFLTGPLNFDRMRLVRQSSASFFLFNGMKINVLQMFSAKITTQLWLISEFLLRPTWNEFRYSFFNTLNVMNTMLCCKICDGLQDL